MNKIMIVILSILIVHFVFARNPFEFPVTLSSKPIPVQTDEQGKNSEARSNNSTSTPITHSNSTSTTPLPQNQNFQKNVEIKKLSNSDEFIQVVKDIKKAVVNQLPKPKVIKRNRRRYRTPYIPSSKVLHYLGFTYENGHTIGWFKLKSKIVRVALGRYFYNWKLKKLTKDYALFSYGRKRKYYYLFEE